MYWSRTGNPGDILLILAMSCLWSLGGMLLTTCVFRLKRSETLITGTALGLMLFISLSGMLTHWLPPSAAFWIASAAILLAGCLAAGRRRLSPWRALRPSLTSWPSGVGLVLSTLLFVLVNRGLAIFDDYHNLPLISVMASGDIPPHFYLNPDQLLTYHYGLHLFAAALVRVGGLFPWSAYDLTNALVLALTIGASALWFRRMTRNRLASTLGTGIVATASGARWLLLLLPVPWLVSLSEHVQLIGSGAATGPDLYTALTRPWNIEGGGPIPFPFAYASGVLKPLIHTVTGSAGVPFLVPLLLLLLAQRRWEPASASIYALLLASLALTAEEVFGVLWVGMAVAMAAGWIMSRVAGGRKPGVLPQALILVMALAVAVVHGGVFSEAIRRMIGGLGQSSEASYGFVGFLLQWPPEQVSVHLGALRIFDPGQAFIAILELGPILLLAPLVVVRSAVWIRRGSWIQAGLGIGSVVAFILPLVVHYAVERDTTRITDSALIIWVVLGLPILWRLTRRAGGRAQVLIGTWAGVTCLSGIVLFAIQLVAIPQPVRSYFVTGEDARLSRLYWDRLEGGAQVFDPWPYRAVTLFGRPVKAFTTLYQAMPEWVALHASPEPAALARQGFSYVYADQEWWWRLTPELRDAYGQACVRLVDSVANEGGIFRRLYDVSGCR